MSITATTNAETVFVQRAFSTVSTINLLAYLNPYDGCFVNSSCYDFIIAGGGTSGPVIANRLSQDPKIKVLLIDAGRNFPLETGLASLLFYNHRSNHDWNYTSVNDGCNMQCHRTKVFAPTLGKVLGGMSSTNFMTYSQGDPSDYNEMAAMTKEPSWKFKNILRLLKKIERFEDFVLFNSEYAVYHGFNGSVGITKDKSPVIKKYLKAFKDVGQNVVIDLNQKVRLGYTRAVNNIAGGLRQNSAYAYLLPVRERKNLVVIKNTQVTKIIFDKNKNAVGVVAKSLDNNITLVFKARKEVIIAAGTFNTPKLLQLSGIGPKKLLKKCNITVVSDLPVGKNYQTHVAVVMNFRTEKTRRPFIPEQHDIRDFPLPTFIGLAALNKSQEYPDYRTENYIVNWTPADILVKFAGFFQEFENRIVDIWYNATIGREVLYTILHATKTTSKGTVEINSVDPYEKPIFKPNFFSDHRDLENLVKYMKHYLNILNSKYFKKVGAALIDPTNGRCGKFDLESDEFLACYVRCLMAPLDHHQGTASMGLVVDGRLRVKGVKCLRVVDASVIPNGSSGDPMIPAMVIAENAAEMIKEDTKNI